MAVCRECGEVPGVVNCAGDCVPCAIARAYEREEEARYEAHREAEMERQDSDPFADWYSPGYPTALDEMNANEADDYRREDAEDAYLDMEMEDRISGGGWEE